MESTREQVARLLRARGGATVAELSEELGVGHVSVRRHLDHLRAEGLADVRVERHGVGRPAFVYCPTEAAEERVGSGYSRLLSRLYEGLRSLERHQVEGRDGEQVLRTAFEAVAEQVVEEHKSEVGADSLEGRVAETSVALQPEGILDSWEKRQDGYHLLNSTCPYQWVAQASSGPCELDRRAIERLVAAPVRQVSRIVDGRPVCEYIVAAKDREHTTKPADRLQPVPRRA